jgi:hypothetical protein
MICSFTSAARLSRTGLGQISALDRYGLTIAHLVEKALDRGKLALIEVANEAGLAANLFARPRGRIISRLEPGIAHKSLHAPVH